RTPSGAGVVLVAAGPGTRLGADRPKAFVELAGATLLSRALGGVLAVPAVEEGVLVGPASHRQEVGGLTGTRQGVRISAGAGGAERTGAVAAGLGALSANVARVLVHDAARCLTPMPVFTRVLAALADGAKGAIPGVPVVDTIKAVDERGVITATPDRAPLRAVQTPQGFDRGVLERAHAAGTQATDDAALVEALGYDVIVVEGDHRALKITTAADLVLAEHLLATGSRG